MSRAFTATGCKIERKLSSEITVQKDEKTYKTIALWDTGASGTCISQDVINELALNPSGCVDMATPSGSSKANTYILDLLLPNHVKVKDLIVIGSEIGKQRIGVLVGMDVITKGDFINERKRIGDLTELQCAAAFCELGYVVSFPYGDSARYDFIVDVGGKLLRIQCKSAEIIDGGAKMIINCSSTRVNTKNIYRHGYTKDEIDFFATFYNNKCYLIPIEEAENVAIRTLRLTPPLNGQRVKISYANDYEIEKILNKYIEG